MDLAPLWDSFAPLPDPREIRRPASAIDICGTNYGKPYPPAGGAAALPPPNAELSVPVSERQPTAAVLQGEQGTWLAAYSELQRETAAAHTAWQEATTQTHLAFLQSVERSCAALAQAAGLPAADLSFPSIPGMAPFSQEKASPFGLRGPVAADLLGLDHSLSDRSSPVASGAHGLVRPAIGSRAGEATLAHPSSRPRFAPPLETSPSRHPSAQHVSHVVIPEAAAGSRSSGPDSAGLLAALLAVVAEKTGYPVDLLRPEMALEADLGIDSIKRIEILSALEERLPGQAEVDPATVSALRTLGDVLDHLQQRAPEKGELPAIAAGQARECVETGGLCLNRFEVEVVATPPPGLGLAGLAACKEIHIVGDGDGVAQELAALFGARALLVDVPPPEAEAVIVLAGLGGDGAADAAGTAVRQVFQAARTVANAFTRRGGVFVTVHDSGGDFGRSGGDRAWLRRFGQKHE